MQKTSNNIYKLTIIYSYHVHEHTNNYALTITAWE